MLLRASKFKLLFSSDTAVSSSSLSIRKVADASTLHFFGFYTLHFYISPPVLI